MAIRIQRKRTKGWKMPDNTVYVGRGSKWGNPFKVGVEYVRRRMSSGGGQKANVVMNNEHACRLFERFTAKETWFLEHIIELKGKNLACWCSLDKPCHADILLKLANKD